MLDNYCIPPIFHEVKYGTFFIKVQLLYIFFLLNSAFFGCCDLYSRTTYSLKNMINLLVSKALLNISSSHFGCISFSLTRQRQRALTLRPMRMMGNRLLQSVSRTRMCRKSREKSAALHDVIHSS